jgi:hypothetical protein
MTWLKVFLAFSLLRALTGSSVLSLLILGAGFWLLDRSTVRVVPRAVRALRRWQREGQLRRTLSHNPHDRGARLELGRLLLERGRYAEAMALVRPNVDAGDDEPDTLFVLGSALLGAGYDPQGEALLDGVVAQDPDFRLGEVDLVRGRVRLSRGDLPGARAALEALLVHRPGTVEGRVLLSRVLQAQGDGAGAKRLREEAWEDYKAAPSFRRREERLWAWRARPERPAMYAAAAALVALVATQLFLPEVRRYAEEQERVEEARRRAMEEMQERYADDE